MAHGHVLRLIPTSYMKPFEKRQKNDFADTAAIAEEAFRPSKNLAAPKSAEKRWRAVPFRMRK